MDAGKTTFCEQLLYQTHAIRAAGRVDHQDTFLDIHPLEKERGITIFSDQAVFDYAGERWYLLDTPGHVDFSGEMERAVWVMDCALLLVSAVEGIQGHTRNVWRLLRERNVPTLIFINKTDREGADPAGVLAAMREKLSPACMDFSALARETMETALAEQLAQWDDGLLERYLETGYDSGIWLGAARRGVLDGRLFPVWQGSALRGEGIPAFLDGLSQLLGGSRTEQTQAPFSARVYKVRHDRQGGRITFFKVTSGTLRVKEALACPGPDGAVVMEKANELRCYAGARYSTLSVARAGELCAAAGPKLARPGDTIGAAPARGRQAIRPLLAAQVLFDRGLRPQTVLDAFRILEEEDPLLSVRWDAHLQQIQVHVMGDVQLEVLRALAQERFGLAVSFGACKILYQETIAAPVTGYGHFEPLRHYAEVHLRLSPAPRGSGIRFDSACPTDVLDAGWQNLVRTHVLEREHRGVLTGSPLTDVQITLLTGRAHLKHTEGGDFRQAVYRAVRQGLMQASSVLLEPFYRFEARVGPESVGRLLSDLQRMSCGFDPPQDEGGQLLVCGRGPAVTLMGYAQALAALTRGHGSLNLVFDRYEPCHNAQEVCTQRAYDPLRDVEHTPDSVFCSHGAGYPVRWQDARAQMHCKS